PVARHRDRHPRSRRDRAGGRNEQCDRVVRAGAGSLGPVRIRGRGSHAAGAERPRRFLRRAGSRDAGARMIENVLASRYASAEMKQIWDPAGRIRLERELWIAVLEAQRRLGLDVADEVVEAYRAVVDQVDLRSIADRERVLRHDVKARLEEFNHLAGHESIHLGMTSRDLTENVEQLQVRRSLEVVLTRAVAAIIGMADLAARYAAVPITGRTHNVPAQVTTIGKRFAS